MNETIGLIIGATLGFIITGCVVVEWTTNDRNQLAACDAACAPNGGTEASYRDGDCECRNGAEFDVKELPSNEARP